MVALRSVEVTKFAPNKEVEWTSTYQVCKLLQTEISTAIRSGKKISHIAARCKMSPTTVSNIGYGITKEPRGSTVLSLLNNFGYKVYIR